MRTRIRSLQVFLSLKAWASLANSGATSIHHDHARRTVSATELTGNRTYNRHGGTAWSHDACRSLKHAQQLRGAGWGEAHARRATRGGLSQSRPRVACQEGAPVSLR